MQNELSTEKERNNTANSLRHICLCCGESYRGSDELFLLELDFIKFPVCLVCRSNIWPENLLIIALFANPEIKRDQLARLLSDSFSAYEGSPS